MISVAELSDVHLLLPQIVVNFTRYFLQSDIFSIPADVLYRVPIRNLETSIMLLVARIHCESALYKLNSERHYQGSSLLGSESEL